MCICIVCYFPGGGGGSKYILLIPSVRSTFVTCTILTNWKQACNSGVRINGLGNCCCVFCKQAYCGTVSFSFSCLSFCFDVWSVCKQQTHRDAVLWGIDCSIVVCISIGALGDVMSDLLHGAGASYPFRQTGIYLSDQTFAIKKKIKKN